MIYVVGNSELMSAGVANLIKLDQEIKTFSFWKACEVEITKTFPVVIVYLMPDHIHKEHAFINFLSANTINNRPKILLLTTTQPKLLFSFCDKYGIEGIVDFSCTSIRFDYLVEKVINGEIIREINNIDFKLDIPFILTPFEISFSKLLFEEKSKTEITLLLQISNRTFERHRKKIFEKTKSKSVIGLYKKFQRINLA